MRILTLFMAMAFALVTACRRDEVTQFQANKSQPMAAPPIAAPAPPGMAGEVEPPPTATGAAALKWKLPKGWTEEPAGGMRYATLKPPAGSGVDVSVVVLGGPAGGELANVNRWRGQIGLPPIDEAGLASSRKMVESPIGRLSVFDFTGDGQTKTRMVAAIGTAQDGKTWFVKMVGEAGAVGASATDFTRLLRSLHFNLAN